MLTPFTTEPLRFIDDDGHRLGEWTTTLDDDRLLRVYRDMRRARLVDEKLMTLMRSGRSSFFAQAAGQEATQVGAAHALRPGFDWIWSYYRDQGLALALGAPLLEWFAEVMGKRSEHSKGHQLAHHFGSKPVNLVSQGPSIASQVPPAVGTAYAQGLAGAGDITLCTFGDGATSAGDWHAGMNMAGVLQAPVVFLCENNQYAISVKFAAQSASHNVAMRASAYGMPGYYVDGQDVLAVQATVQEAADRARAGGGPTLIEALTYRYGAHSSSDDDAVYRSREEVATWRGRDPIERFRRFLEREGPWTPEQDAQLGQELGEEIEAAIRQAEALPDPDPETLFEDVYAELPPHLQTQAAWLREELSEP